ncbi:MAG: hypothetical protein PQJ46_14200, partial [Spirochaetales bacterium]|nr:hypothetical protein [Spirochaetales bacterium]
DIEEDYKKAYEFITEAMELQQRNRQEKIINYEINRLILGINIKNKEYKVNIEKDYLEIINYPGGRELLDKCNEKISPNLKKWLEKNKM